MTHRCSRMQVSTLSSDVLREPNMKRPRDVAGRSRQLRGRPEAMMGPRQIDQAALFYEFSLERHVPATHLLRSIDRFVDLSEVRGHLAPFYSSTGRPSIDPELLVRMLLVGYCYGIRSERRLPWPHDASAMPRQCIAAPRSLRRTSGSSVPRDLLSSVRALPSGDNDASLGYRTMD